MATTVNNEGEGEEDHYHHCRHQLPADEIEVATVTSNIQSWYDAGLPFFTKERLQILDRGMRSLKGLPGPVSIPTLNNTLETFHVRTGQVVRKQGIVERIAYVVPSQTLHAFSRLTELLAFGHRSGTLVSTRFWIRPNTTLVMPM